MADSNTAPNRGGKPFTKGDPRINRKGRPKSFDALRELAQQIAHEEAKAKSGNEFVPVVIEGHIATNAELLLRKWASSNDPRLQMAFMEVAFGKAPMRTEVTGKDGAELRVIVEHVRANGTLADS